MRGIVQAGVGIVLAGSLFASTAQAQYVFVGGGLTVPVGEYGDYAKTGWMGAAGIGVPVGDKGLSVGGEVLYGQNSHSDIDGDKTGLTAFMGYLEYRIGDDSKPGVYLLGEAGVMNHKYKPAGMSYEGGSDWKLAVGGGAGVDIPAGSVSVFVEARFLTRSGTNFIPVLAGVAIPLKR
ncbi:MAG: hypothetical protein R2909_13035 [Gemmatimonadales bacterium]